MAVQKDVALWAPASADGGASAVLHQGATIHPAAEPAELFESLVTEHWRLIYRIAFRLTGNQSEADDLAQDAVLEAFRAFSHFQPGTRFDRWLARIMTHTFIDHTRRRRRHAVVSLDEGDAAEPADPAPGPEERASQHELHDRVQRALTGLAPEFRTAVVLVDLEGHSYEDASHIMGIPIGTVRSRLHRARHALRHTLEPLLVAS
jgi:RNA polymerase sigma-70 factor (ECF subfamily)